MTTADPFVDDAPAVPSALWNWLKRASGAVRDSLGHGLAEGHSEEDSRLRIFFVMALFSAAFLFLAIGATRAALFPQAERRHTAPAALRADRADLTDRNGEILATDVPRYALYLRPVEITDKAGTLAAIEAVAPAISQTQLENAIEGRAKGKQNPDAAHHETNLLKGLLNALLRHKAASKAADASGRIHAYFVAGGLTPALKDKLHDLALPGLDFEEESGRFYPMGELAAHAIGYANKDGAGVAGAELGFDGAVRGNGGKAPVPLSLDLRVQSALQDELKAAGDHFAVKDAVGIVVNIRTGEILAMASYPFIDANAPAQIQPGQTRDARDWAAVNHAAATVYEPGSVFKVFTVAMGLDAGVAKVTDRFDVHSPIVLPGQTIHDYDKGDTVLPLWEVFTHSSNIGAARLGLKAGAETETRYFRDFGLFAAAPSELAESARPLVPKRFSENIVATTAFGHSISVSPLMLATGMSAVLNGGLYRPLTLRRLEAGQAPAPGRRVIQASTSRTMLNLMRLNVTNGTGAGADVGGYNVGGKTGTATKLVNGRYAGGKKNLASFAAVFPTVGRLDEDRYLTLVMMDEPRVTSETGGFTTGGAVTAPIAGKIINRIAPLLGLRRIGTERPVAKANRDNVDASKLTEGGL
jgi:cell division protein FtsI (penicillin-binding protein 3)